MTWSRRAFLGGAAATVGLPFLPSLVRGARADDAPPVRLMWFYVPNGIRMDHWRPQGFGTDFTLGPTMASLADVRDDLLVLSGLENAAGWGDRPGDHARGTATLLTCTEITFDGVANGPSADQIAAAHLGAATPFRSLELGVEGGQSSGVCDSGYACAYTQNVSWADAATPMSKISQPRVAFDRLFAGADRGRTEAERLRRRAYRASVLDVVREQASDLKSRLSVDDRLQLDQYLTGIREIERRLDTLDPCDPGSEPPADVTLSDHADVMVDIAVSALACGTTHVVTLMLGNAASNLVYNFLPGISGAHHEVSHHQGLASNLDQLSIIDAWEVERFGRLVRKLAAMPEGDGRLLDHTLVAFASEISDGNRHNHDDLPVLLAGGGGGSVATGRHLDVSGEPLADLWLGMLQAAGVPVSTLGDDGTRALPGLSG